MSRQWFVVYCKSREELRAQQNLGNQGIHSFFPKIVKEKIVRGKKTAVEVALFPINKKYGVKQKIRGKNTGSPISKFRSGLSFCIFPSPFF